ncbi:MAG: hypothetical protein O7G83_07655 [Proteobacteria bacterium]|nr:hypothetical protein [Pseudomonadota bacterium]
MDIRMTTPSPAARDCEAARIVVAIELSNKSWLVGMADAAGRQDQPAYRASRRRRGVDGSADQVVSKGGNGARPAGRDRVVLRGGRRRLLAASPARGSRREEPRFRPGHRALARKLLVALWRYVETGLVPEGALFKA